VLQEREFYPWGASKPVQVDVRIITATNKDLQAEVKEGNFSRGLFLPASCDSDSSAAATRAQRRYPAFGQPFLKNNFRSR